MQTENFLKEALPSEQVSSHLRVGPPCCTCRKTTPVVNSKAMPQSPLLTSSSSWSTQPATDHNRTAMVPFLSPTEIKCHPPRCHPSGLRKGEALFRKRVKFMLIWKVSCSRLSDVKSWTLRSKFGERPSADDRNILHLETAVLSGPRGSLK